LNGFFCLSGSLFLQIASRATEPKTLALDDQRSRATFEVKVLYIIGLHGEFGSVSGTLRADQDTASVDATIETNAVHMRNHHYEGWAKSAEFFDAEHFPQIHFSSEPFPLQHLTSGGEIRGVLTIRGMRQPALFTLAPAECAAPLSGGCAVAASGTIRRSDFGMRSRRGALADKVDLNLAIFVRPPSP